MDFVDIGMIIFMAVGAISILALVITLAWFLISIINCGCTCL